MPNCRTSWSQFCQSRSLRSLALEEAGSRSMDMDMGRVGSRLAGLEVEGLKSKGRVFVFEQRPLLGGLKVGLLLLEGVVKLLCGPVEGMGVLEAG